MPTATANPGNLARRKVRSICSLLIAMLAWTACATSPPRAEETAPCPMELGKQIYQRSCASCHDSGAGGAQVIGDRDGWRSRIAKEMEELLRHSIHGFTGAVGDMPPRGGDPTLDDAEVAAAVCYLVEQSR